jgi:hypothetical protein
MYTHIIDRSGLDDIVKITKDGRRVSRIEDLEERDFHRTDIVLLNDTRSGKEYVIHIRKNGTFAGDMWILDVLTDHEYDEVLMIRERMIFNANNHEAAMKLLVK